MDIFKQVSELNVKFGHTKGDPNNPDWDALKNQALNILDEYEELIHDGIAKKDMNEVRDAICDILTFTLGLGHMAGVPVNDDMAAVDASNNSKFCANVEELIATIDKYESLGIEVYVDGEYPFRRVKSAKQQTGTDGKLYQKDKMLKSVSFKEPVLLPL